MSALFLKLFFVHLVGDYLLQFGFLAEGKEQYKLKSWHVWVHVLIHGVLVHLVLQTWWITIVTLITHGLIDACKIQFQRADNGRRWFFLDQLLHVLVIIGIVMWVYPPSAAGLGGWFDDNLAVLIGLIFVTKPAKYLIGVFISRWQPQADEENESLCGAGAWIGIIERLLVFLFVLLGQWQGVGFLLAAKSVFRFGDLNRSADRKRTEYVLIGTLVSFAAAILAGLLAATLG